MRGVRGAVFVPRHDQQAVVLLGPVGVRAEVRLQPGVAGADLRGDVVAVVHVVTQVGDDKADVGQRREASGIVRKLAEVFAR